MCVIYLMLLLTYLCIQLDKKYFSYRYSWRTTGWWKQYCS